jgi:SAM-dependent methyltransferase
LEGINQNLVQILQEKIRKEGCTGKAFTQLIRQYVPHNGGRNRTHGDPEYDNLDNLINGLFFNRSMPHQTKELEHDMVYYQKTPARMVFDLVEKLQLSAKDIFFDLGSGLGQEALLVNLLSGATTIGVEFEPAFCSYARECASNFNLSNVTFIQQDAREADFSKGTVYFMFTPFKGDFMKYVLEKLRRQSLQRKIKIITYGPCSTQVALQSWLHRAIPGDESIYTLGYYCGNQH